MNRARAAETEGLEGAKEQAPWPLYYIVRRLDFERHSHKVMTFQLDPTLKPSVTVQNQGSGVVLSTWWSKIQNDLRHTRKTLLQSD